MAILDGDLHRVQRLVERGEDINQPSRYGFTAVHSAVHHRNAEILEYLLTHGGDPNAPTDLGLTPLHEAARLCYPDIADLLLRRGANPAKSQAQLGTPAAYARWYADQVEASAAQNVVITNGQVTYTTTTTYTHPDGRTLRGALQQRQAAEEWRELASRLDAAAALQESTAP